MNKRKKGKNAEEKRLLSLKTTMDQLKHEIDIVSKTTVYISFMNNKNIGEIYIF
jgi:hypothetical protein